MLETVENIRRQFNERVSKADTIEEIENIRVDFLGKKGILTNALKGLKDIGANDKRAFGIELNKLKNEIEECILAKKASVNDMLQARLENEAERFDFTTPASISVGSLHPVTIIQKNRGHI